MPHSCSQQRFSGCDFQIEEYFKWDWTFLMLLYRLQWTLSSHAEHCQTRRVAPEKENDTRVAWTEIKDRWAEKRNRKASRHYWQTASEQWER